MTPAGRRYRILQTLGRGGFGTVYRAELLAPGGFTKIVALKVLNAAGEESDDVALRLRDEARMLGLIQHRAIVRVDSLALLADGWAVVMEYVPGVDVSVLAGRPDLPMRVALEIIEEVASALHAAYTATHERTGKALHLVHRDIKPSNVRVTPQGEVKVLDFGVARAEFATREAVTRSMTFGSYRYMAPERLEGDDTHEGDVWALGVMALELLAGAPFDLPPRIEKRWNPWVAEQVETVCKRLGTARAAPRCIRAISELLPQMTALDPDDRPSAQQVRRAIRANLARLEGPWLRGWAEDSIPRLVQEISASVHDPMPGHVLVEKAGSVDMVGVEVDTHGVRTGRMARVSSPDPQPGGPTLVTPTDRDEDSADPEARALSTAPLPPRDSTPAFSPASPSSSHRSASDDPLDAPIRIRSRVGALLAGLSVAGVVVATMAVVGIGLWVSAPAQSEETGDGSASEPGTELATTSAPTVDRAPDETDMAPSEAGLADAPASPVAADPVADSVIEASRQADRETRSIRPPVPAIDPAPAVVSVVTPSTPPQDGPKAPVTAPTGTWRANGDARTVLLIAADGERHTPGSVPVGRYQVHADLGQGLSRQATAEIQAGATLIIKCSATGLLKGCRPLPPK